MGVLQRSVGLHWVYVQGNIEKLEWERSWNIRWKRGAHRSIHKEKCVCVRISYVYIYIYAS